MDLVGPCRCQFLANTKEKLIIYTCIVETLRQTALIAEYQTKSAITKPCHISHSNGQDYIILNKVKAIRRSVFCEIRICLFLIFEFAKLPDNSIWNGSVNNNSSTFKYSCLDLNHSKNVVNDIAQFFTMSQKLWLTGWRKSKMELDTSYCQKGSLRKKIYKAWNISWILRNNTCVF